MSNNKIEVTEHEPMRPAVCIELTTTDELCKSINELFRATFSDYSASLIRCQFNNQIMNYTFSCSLIFKVLPESEYNNPNGRFGFMPMANNNRGDYVDKVARLSKMASTGTKVEITEEGKSLLSEFMIRSSLKNNTIDWNKATVVVNGDHETYVTLNGLNLVSLIARIKGEVVDGEKKQYQISPIAPTTNGNIYQSVNNNWKVSLMQLSEDNLAESANLFGMTYNASPIPGMVTAVH